MPMSFPSALSPAIPKKCQPEDLALCTKSPGRSMSRHGLNLVESFSRKVRDHQLSCEPSGIETLSWRRNVRFSWSCAFGIHEHGSNGTIVHTPTNVHSHHMRGGSRVHPGFIVSRVKKDTRSTRKTTSFGTCPVCLSILDLSKRQAYK